MAASSLWGDESDEDDEVDLPTDLNGLDLDLPSASRLDSFLMSLAQYSPLLPVPSEMSHVTSGEPSQPSKSIGTWEELEVPSPEPIEPHTCGNLNCAVAKFFTLPELVENTLIFLAPENVRSLQRVNKTWKALIQDRPALRVNFFVKPEWQRLASDFDLLPFKIPGLTIRRGETVHLGQWVEVEMTLIAALEIDKTSRHSARRPRPTEPSRGAVNDNLESQMNMPNRQKNQDRFEFAEMSEVAKQIHRLRTMHLPQPSPLFVVADLQITRPPLVSAQAFLVDDGSAALDTLSPAPAPKAKSKISCDAGITLGFLAEVARKLLDTRYGGLGETADANATERRVVFKTIVSFCRQTDAAPRKRSGTRFVTRID